LRDSLDAFVRRDTNLAQKVLNEDDALDSLKNRRSSGSSSPTCCRIPATIEPALDLILVSRHLERIGDHATNVAEDVIFMVSAKGRPPPRGGRRRRLGRRHRRRGRVDARSRLPSTARPPLT